MEWNSSMSKRSRALKRAEGMEDLKKWDNKKLGTFSGLRIDVGKIEEWDERERGRAVKYDSGIREIWDWDDGIRCPRPPWAPVGPRGPPCGHKGLSCPSAYSAILVLHLHLFSFASSLSFFLVSCVFSGSFSSFSSLLASTLVVPSFLAETRCPVKGSAK